jgi:hypothetical protein
MDTSDHSFERVLEFFGSFEDVPSAQASLDLVSGSRLQWKGRVFVTTSMMDMIFTPDARNPWQADPMPLGSNWLRATYQERGSDPTPCFSFELFRMTDHPKSPGHHAFPLSVAGDVCKVATAPQVLDAYLMQVEGSAGKKER